MKIVLQRVSEASVKVDGRIIGKIDSGLCLLVGIEKGDTIEDAHNLANKILQLRIFPDEEGKMNRSIQDKNGEVLAVSQFTLAGSVNKGRRPSFDNAEDPQKAEELFNDFITLLQQSGLKVEKGVFGALMSVHIVNDGPVTFVLESRGRS
jgi:D-tyrosyl-tRNA(Tyr) deacylase